MISNDELAAKLLSFVMLVREHREELNANNYFPVKDCDTGDNVYATLSRFDLLAEGPSALESVLQSPYEREAAGNSGRLLSGTFRNLAEIVVPDGGLTLTGFHLWLERSAVPEAPDELVPGAFHDTFRIAHRAALAAPHVLAPSLDAAAAAADERCAESALLISQQRFAGRRRDPGSQVVTWLLESLAK